MSRIDELIEELCPEGIRFEPLGDHCEVFSGFPFKSDFFNTEGLGVPLIRIRDVNSGPSGTFFSGDFDARFLVEDGDVLIGMDGIFSCIRWGRGRGLLNQRVSRIQNIDEAIHKDFAYYYLIDQIAALNSGREQSTVAHISVTDIRSIRIPIPPLEVQREIVSILDKFTQLEAELEAELEARRIQYEVTRDRLLDFSGDLDKHPMAGMIREYCLEGILNKELRSCGTFKKGGSFQKKDMIEIGQPAVHYGQIHTNPVVFLLQPPTRVSDAVFSSSRVADPGDLIIADTSEDLDGVATAVAWLGDSQIAVSGHVLIFSHDMEPKYVSYFFKTSEFKRQKNMKSKGVKVKDISSQRLGEVVIPVPPLEIQKEIVSILDKLDTLVNDITIGLPAEIAARRKQYEHYRNKLLTFKELEAA